MFSRKGLGFIASAAGDPKRLHPDTELCKSFEEAKVFIEADLSKDLPKTFRFQSDRGVDAVVEFKYPWLPPKCHTCSKWGHLKEVCLLNKRTQTEDSCPREDLVKNSEARAEQLQGTASVMSTDNVDKENMGNNTLERKNQIQCSSVGLSQESNVKVVQPDLETQAVEIQEKADTSEIVFTHNTSLAATHFGAEAHQLVELDSENWLWETLAVSRRRT